MNTSNTWHGKLVRLRGLEPEDWEHFYVWNDDTEMARSLYFIPPPQSREAVRQWAARVAVERPENDQYTWVIENLLGEMAGSIGTHDCNRRNGTFTYAVAIRREFQRRGYAAEAVRLVLDYFFNDLRYQKVTAHVYAFNASSLALQRKLSFRQEGQLRRMYYSRGTYHDELIFGLTAEEFNASKVE